MLTKDLCNDCFIYSIYITTVITLCTFYLAFIDLYIDPSFIYLHTSNLLPVYPDAVHKYSRTLNAQEYWPSGPKKKTKD